MSILGCLIVYFVRCLCYRGKHPCLVHQQRSVLRLYYGYETPPKSIFGFSIFGALMTPKLGPGGSLKLDPLYKCPACVGELQMEK